MWIVCLFLILVINSYLFLILNKRNSSNDILALYQIELAVRIKSQTLCNSKSKLNLLNVVYRRHNSLVRRLLSISIYHNHDQYEDILEQTSKKAPSWKAFMLKVDVVKSVLSLRFQKKDTTCSSSEPIELCRSVPDWSRSDLECNCNRR